MKGKRYTSEEKIRIMRAADGGKTVNEVCRTHNISEVSFHRWKRQFGMMEINEAERLKELERENAELKKMLAEALLKNRVLEAVCEKNGEPGAPKSGGQRGGGGGDVLRAGSVPVPRACEVDVLVSGATAERAGAAVGTTDARTLRGEPALRVSADRGAVET